MAQISSGGGGGSAPKARLSLPKARVSTGSNPRGTAITANPRPTPAQHTAVTLGTGANPRGTAIRLPKLTGQTPRPKVPAHLGSKIGGHGGLGPIAAVVSHPNVPLATLLKPAGGILGRLGSELVSLPKSTLVGLETTVSEAVAHPTHIPSIAGHIINGDPIYQAITQGSLKPLGQNPLGTLLDATGVYGASGRVAGAAGRAAGLDAASLARDSREIAPGLEKAAVARGYSPNLFTSAIQHAIDRHGKLMSPKLAENTIKRQVAITHAAEAGERHAHEAMIIKQLRDAMPKGKEERAVAPLVAATGQNRAGLERLLADQERAGVPKGIDPDTLRSREKAMQAIRDALAKDDQGKFDWPAVNHVADVYNQLQGHVEDLKAIHGLKDAQEMQQALDNRRALLEPNVHYLQKPVKDPALQSVVKDAAAELKLQKGNLKTATEEQIANTVEHKAHISDESLVATKAEHATRVKFYQDKVAEADKAMRRAVKTVNADKNKIRGTVIEDPTRGQLTSGPLKGLSVRPLTHEDVQQIAASDPAAHAYVSAKNPEREAVPTARQALGRKSGDQLIRPAEQGLKHYTGQALLAGDYRAGASALAHSILGDVRRVSAAREDQAFFDRYSIVDKNGHDRYPNAAEAKTAAEEYTQRTGITARAIQDPQGDYRIVPKTAVRELNAQRALDQPTTLTKINKAFRHTVLPYSPKLPVMHTIENASRVTALEKGNLLRIPFDYARGRSVLNAADPALRDRVASITTPGGLSQAGAAGDEELGHLPVERNVPHEVIHRSVKAFDALGSQIIHFQRILEKGAQTVALGAHTRTMMQEWGHSWAAANTAVSKYADELARGLATPAEAARAAQYMHKTMGQYNAFSANVRYAMRYAPFASWYMNAARLIFVTLPRDHTLFSALVQDANQAASKQWGQQHAGLPGDLQTAMNVGPNAWLDVGKLTPIGLPPENPVSIGSQLVLPWASSAALALAGKDPFMQDLKGPTTGFGQSPAPQGVRGKGAGTAVLEAIEQLAEGLGGPANTVARLLYQHGGTFYNTDVPLLHLASGGTIGSVAVKPGSTKQAKGILNLPGALDRVVDPFHPTTFTAKAPITGGRIKAIGSGAKTLGARSKVLGHVPKVVG